MKGRTLEEKAVMKTGISKKRFVNSTADSRRVAALAGQRVRRVPHRVHLSYLDVR
ncbi:MAG TPA: hypothetical protein VFT55_08450 [Planctomycetota bacterium]|nr:hypothetical protein [Planctomycetota bacterium]